MTVQVIPVEAFDLAVFGGTGDLARRKLLPGLYYRDRDRQIPPQSRILGVARGDLGRQAYVAQVDAALRSHVPAADLDEADLARFLDRVDYAALDALDPADGGWGALAAALDDPGRSACSTSRRRRTCSARSAAASRAPGW